MAQQIRHKIRDDQARHGETPCDMDRIIQQAIEAAFERVGDRPLPVRARVLRSEAAAKYLTVDVDTLRDWRRNGTGPRFRRIGSRCVYCLEDLDAFIDKLPAPATSRRKSAEAVHAR
jgi:Helix-turn-helix domain